MGVASGVEQVALAGVAGDELLPDDCDCLSPIFDHLRARVLCRHGRRPAPAQRPPHTTATAGLKRASPPYRSDHYGQRGRGTWERKEVRTVFGRRRQGLSCGGVVHE